MSSNVSYEKDLEVVLDNKLIINQQCVTETGRTNSILGCLNRKIITALWDVMVLLFSSLVRPQLNVTFYKDIPKVQSSRGS